MDSGQEGRLRPAPAVADRGRDDRHLQRAGLHLALADRGRAECEFAVYRARVWERALGRAFDTRRVVEAEAFRGAHEAFGAELHPQRREDGVA